MIPIPPATLLGSAGRDSLVPFHPAHWQELRSRTRDAAAASFDDDALAVALDMAVLVKTVFIDGRPEMVVGLHLLPDGGSPWVMTVAPTVDRLARSIIVSQAFIAESLTRCSVLVTELEHCEGASFLWFVGLGFRQVGTEPLTFWEMRRADGLY